eukprot:6180322-Pleurochrysis_carterae.AAC.1
MASQPSKAVAQGYIVRLLLLARTVLNQQTADTRKLQSFHLRLIAARAGVDSGHLKFDWPASRT